MFLLNSSFFKKYLLPGFVFQSVVIAGGYGTGREIIEYFLKYGPLGGLLGMFLVTTLMWSVMLAVTFEFSRIFRAYDYRTFFMNLLGRYWVIFEVLYLIFLLIVLAVIGAAAGVLLRDNFGLPYMVGVLIILSAIGFLTFKGSGLIEKFLSGWSIVLYLVYGAFLIAGFIKFGPQIQKNLADAVVLPGWALGGFKYALYNMAIVPAVLFCLKHIGTRKEALKAGFMAGIIGILPGFLFFIAVVSHCPAVLPPEVPAACVPENIGVVPILIAFQIDVFQIDAFLTFIEKYLILNQEVPAVYLLKKVGFAPLLIAFQIVLFGTLIETGTGFIHAVNERIQSALKARGKELPRKLRPLIALVLLLCGLGISIFGLKDLIQKGYGSLSWGVFIVFFIPLMTIGLYKMIKMRNSMNP